MLVQLLTVCTNFAVSLSSECSCAVVSPAKLAALNPRCDAWLLLLLLQLLLLLLFSASWHE
jgi:hypothetical protein